MRHAVSKYDQTITQVTEEKCLVEALKEMGFEVEVHPQSSQLNSYYLNPAHFESRKVIAMLE
jgi:hypothetical protein